MAYPYTTSKPGLVATINQLRSSFPNVVNAETLKKWSIAANNEGTVINVLKFIGIIDNEGNKNPVAAKVFVEHDNKVFADKFKQLIKTSYKNLFETWGDEKAWNLEKAQLINFFRHEDDTSARVGQEQAATFSLLASVAGYGPPIPEGKKTTSGRKTNTSSANAINGTKKSVTKKQVEVSEVTSVNNLDANSPNSIRNNSGPALTVRIEINLPVADDQAVYDRIFKSIKENLYP